MQANWGLILNVLLLIGVMVAIGRLIKARRQNYELPSYQPSLGPVETKAFDDIIAVRRLSPDFADREEFREEPKEILADRQENVRPEARSRVQNTPPSSLVLFLQAKEDRQLAGYELLQTVLAAGLRFGEGQIFHRHQHANGQGPVLCSLAAATASGVFDLQNIGAFSVRGLCLFMHRSANPTIDGERFSIMLDTARQLAEGLDTRILDDQKKPFNELSLARYQSLLQIDEVAESVL